MSPLGKQSSGPLDPTIARARTALREMLVPELEAASNPLVLVACSGGPDSMALAATAAFVLPRLGARAGAVIVDHDLQTGSAAAAQQAAEECTRLGLDPVTVVKTEVSRAAGAGGLEAAARSARYAALRAQLQEHDAQAILLGHTLDDQAEQVLLSLARGSGTRSIAGIPARRDVFYRPFLHLRRTDTEHICAHLGIQTWLDPTNEMPPDTDGGAASSQIDIPRRTVVRNVLLPALEKHLGPGIAQSLARTAQLARDDESALSELARDLMHRARKQQNATEPAAGKGLHLDCAVLLRAPRALRTRVLHQACVQLGVPTSPLARVHISALDDLVVNWHGQGPVDLPGGHQGRRQCGTLILYTARK